MKTRGRRAASKETRIHLNFREGLDDADQVQSAEVGHMLGG
jgi:hypothetical protein